MQVVVDQLLTHYTQYGDKKAPGLLILHGWADSSLSWQATATKLAEHYHVVVPDLPGFGSTQAPATTWDLQDYARWTSEFLKKIDFSPNGVMGHSNGGAIAVYGLANQLFSASKLVLVASAGIRLTQKGRKRALRLLAKTGKIITLPLPSSVRHSLRQKLYNTIGSDMLVAEHMQETFKKVVGHDIQPEAKKLQLPTLLIYGENDQETPAVYGEQFHELIADSTLEILPGCGHFVQKDEPLKLVKLIEDFLA